jgi:hypothetical protein
MTKRTPSESTHTCAAIQPFCPPPWSRALRAPVTVASTEHASPVSGCSSTTGMLSERQRERSFYCTRESSSTPAQTKAVRRSFLWWNQDQCLAMVSCPYACGTQIRAERLASEGRYCRGRTTCERSTARLLCVTYKTCTMEAKYTPGLSHACRQRPLQPPHAVPRTDAATRQRGSKREV